MVARTRTQAELAERDTHMEREKGQAAKADETKAAYDKAREDFNKTTERLVPRDAPAPIPAMYMTDYGKTD